MFKIIIKENYKLLLVLAVLVVIFYGNTLKNGFIYDDYQQIVENEYIQSLKYLPKVVTGCIWEHAFGGCKDRAIYYRPVQSLSYILTYQISSKPWAFHLVNIVYFLIIIFLIFILAKVLTENSVFAFISSLIFLIHPINAEVVNWAAAVPDLTFAIFVLLATLFYIKYRKTGVFKTFLISAFLYFLGILSKEPAIVLPLIFFLIDWQIFKIDFEDFFQWREIKNYLILVFFAVFYFVMRTAVLGGGLIQSGKSPFSPFSIAERIYTFFYLLFEYIRNILFPYPRVFFFHFVKRSNILSLEFLALFLLVLVFSAVLFLFYRKRKNLLFLSGLWLIIFLLPVLIFVESAGESVFSERYAFVPLIGFSFLLSYFLTDFFQKNQKTKAVVISLLVIIGGIFWYTIYFDRNSIWSSNEVLYTRTLAQNPDATPIRFNYAVLLRNDKQDFEAAKIQLEGIVKRKPNWADISMVYLHLGDYYRDRGEEENALEYYHKSATASDDWKTHFGWNRLGVFYAKKEDYVSAIRYFCQALQANPESQESQANFNRAVELSSKAYENDQTLLYKKISENKTFIKSDKEKIRFKEESCQEEKCVFFFTPGFESSEIILPSLISVGDQKQNGVKIENSGFDNQTGLINIVVDSKYKDETLTFLFPTCDGIYYEVVSSK